MTSRIVTALVCLSCCAVMVLPTAAQQPMSRVKELYATASYEEALAALEDLEQLPDADTIEPVEYQILCLVGLGHIERAQQAMEQLIVKHPRYRPDAKLVPPKVETQFAMVRQRLLPDIIRSQYANAKASFAAKDHGDTLFRLALVLDLLNEVPDDPSLADLRLVVSGFRDLAAAAASDPAAPDEQQTMGLMTGPASHATSSPAEADAVYERSALDIVPPVPLKQVVPPVLPDTATAAQGPGLFEIVIDENGQVQSAIVRRSINAQYDALLLRETRNWRYRPATLNGKTVKFRKRIEVYTATMKPRDQP